MSSFRLASVITWLALVITGCDGPGGGGATTALPNCNNGALDQGELCDGANVGPQTCQSAGYEYGVLVCNRSCTNYDYSGCSGGNVEPDAVGGDTSGPSDTSDTGTGPETTGPGGAPNIISLNANVTTLELGDTLVITAVVTDPDGIDDLIGGNLVNAQTGGSYGAFATSAAEGSYTIQLTWEALTLVQPLDAPPAGKDVVFRAEFYDVAGKKSERTLTIKFRCGGAPTEGLCASECIDFTGDVGNCGDCGEVCTLPSGAEYYGCYAAICGGWFEVEASRFAGGGVTCDELCRELGRSCPWDASVAAGDVRTSDGGNLGLSCHETYDGVDVPYFASCLCAEGNGIVTPPDPTTVTIKSIQGGSASIGCSASGDITHGAEVTIEGVVAVARFTLNSTLSGFIVSDGTQDAYASILVRFPTTQTWSFTPGQRVRVVGAHHEYYCMTQLAATAMTTIGSATAPQPRTIGHNLDAATLEQWEGMLVHMANVTVTGPTEFPGEVTTDAGVYIDNYLLGNTFVLPEAGTLIPALRGVLVYDFGVFRVAPRSADDY